MQRGGHLSLEGRRRLSEALKGKKRGPLSAETRQKMSESRRGKKHSEEWCRKIAEAKRGKKPSAEARQRMSEAAKRYAQQNPAVCLRVAGWWKGKRHSLAARQKLSELHKGPKNWNWKGGVLPRTRNSIKYKDWRRAVFERDDYTCQECGKRGSRLHAHHIESWIISKSKRYDVTNGLTLCIPCHGKKHRKGESDESALSA